MTRQETAGRTERERKFRANVNNMNKTQNIRNKQRKKEGIDSSIT